MISSKRGRPRPQGAFLFILLFHAPGKSTKQKHQLRNFQEGSNKEAPSSAQLPCAPRHGAERGHGDGGGGAPHRAGHCISATRAARGLSQRCGWTFKARLVIFGFLFFPRISSPFCFFAFFLANQANHFFAGVRFFQPSFGLTS